MSPLEIAAVVLSLIGVWQTVREDIWCWLTGSISTALFSIAFFQARLYSDVGLQLIYILLNAYGWYQWKFGGRDKAGVPISTMTLRQWGVTALVALASIAALGTALNRMTDTDVAYWDATTTTLSLIAQYLLARKLIENWWVWIAVNALYIGIYIYKGLYLTSGLQLVLILLSVMGYWEWRKSLRATTAVS
jgi:nicotinamide mononucleotide transporter